MLTALLVCGAEHFYGQEPSAQEFEGKRIDSIVFSPGPLLDPADLVKAQPIRVGAALRLEEVGAAIDSLFATGRFSDIRAEAEPSGSGVTLRFVVIPQRFVGGVQVEGKVSNPPNRGELNSFTQLNLGGPFEDADIATGVNSLTHLFQTNGLYRSQVQPHVEPAGEAGQVFITFHVNAGKRTRYAPPVIQGQTLLSDSVILRATGWRFPIIHQWRLVTNARTRGGAQRLQGKYQKQDRLTAKVDLGEVEYDETTQRVRPHLTVTPGPKVQVRTLETKVSKRILKRYLPVYQERTVDPQLLTEGKRNLEEYFQSKGYSDVDVEFRIAPPANDVQVITYTISRGQRHSVVLVNITGNKYFTGDTIRERMFTQAKSFSMRRGRYSEAFRRQDEAIITELYRSNGFRDVKVTIGADTSYQGNAGNLAVSVAIEEGAQWLVERVVLNGFSELRATAIAGLLSSAAGQPFSEVNLASDRGAILTEYFKQGFAGAEVTARWEAAAVPNRVNITYSANEGTRQYVRDVITSGIRRTRPEVIARQMTLKPGDPLSPVDQTAIQKSLYDLGIFARVETAIENPGGAETHKYVLYNLEEGDRYRLNVGVGAQVGRFGTPSNTSLASPGGTTGFSPQISLDVSRYNFLGRGHTVSLRSLYSSIEKLASISYLQPRFRGVEGRSLSYSLLFDDTRDVRTFASRREEASVQLSQKFSKSLTGVFGIAYRRVSVSDVIIPVLLVPQFLQPVRIGIITGSLVQDRRDNRGNPSRGMYNTADIGLAARWLGSERNFGRLLVRNATYYRLTKTVILARQTQLGVIVPFSATPGLTAAQSIPLPERFFGGGADSLRAFPYNQAGPRDTGEALATGGPSSKATGFPLGGNALLFNNVELRFPLWGENIQGVAFHDMGNVYSSIRNVSFRVAQRDLQDFNYMVHAAGFGIRYRTPVGPIRADFAYSINPPAYNGFSGTPVQLLQCNPTADPSTEPSYCQSTRQRINHFQFFFSIGQTF